MSAPTIDPMDYHKVSQRLRKFFDEKGLIECYTQSILSILAACEDVTTLGTFRYLNLVYPLIQTNQMNLEYIILTDHSSSGGYFTTTTSYREEPNPVPGRHSVLPFNLFEFETLADFNGLIQFEKDLLESIGFGDQSKFVEVNYLDMCEKYGTDELTHEHEMQLYKDYGPVVFLKYFPESTSPFWNMKRESGLANKVDVIICGIETIGSAERSVDATEMRELFHTITNGDYANILYEKFGKERVEKELEAFLSLPFCTRSGAGIGISRLIKGMKELNIL